MRYLKSINEHSKDYLNSIINWEMIADAKELSLDYLDQGMILTIYVLNDGMLLYIEIYSHDLNDVEKVWDERIIVYKFDIRYKFFLSEYVDGDDYHKPTENCYIFKNELVDILKEMYPDEKIYYF